MQLEGTDSKWALADAKKDEAHKRVVQQRVRSAVLKMSKEGLSHAWGGWHFFHRLQVRPHAFQHTHQPIAAPLPPPRTVLADVGVLLQVRKRNIMLKVRAKMKYKFLVECFEAIKSDARGRKHDKVPTAGTFFLIHDVNTAVIQQRGGGGFLGENKPEQSVRDPEGDEGERHR